jgi:hypothetical protein
MISGAEAGVELELSPAFSLVYTDKQAVVPLHHASPIVYLLRPT